MWYGIQRKRLLFTYANTHLHAMRVCSPAMQAVYSPLDMLTHAAADHAELRRHLMMLLHMRRFYPV
jgi:hypothetical protein